MSGALLVTIDTEEEFDWNAPCSPKNRSVQHVAELDRLQDLFEEEGVRPTYVVDHPIATTDRSIEVFGAYLRRGTCEIGAHIHPWVNPPLEEAFTPRNTFLCNLPLELQERKVVEITRAIHDAFGRSPTSFKAGRYGIDFRLAPMLSSLGYRCDNSVIAFQDFSQDGGPDFSHFGCEPFALGPPLVPESDGYRPLLEVPCTVGFTRRPFARWSALHRRLTKGLWPKLRAVGILWHARILRKIVLTPEGFDTPDLLLLIRILAERPNFVMNVTLHSPSIQPGNTPYVQTVEQRDAFLASLRKVFRLARSLGAQCLTLSEFTDEYRKHDSVGRPIHASASSLEQPRA